MVLCHSQDTVKSLDKHQIIYPPLSEVLKLILCQKTNQFWPYDFSNYTFSLGDSVCSLRWKSQLVILNCLSSICMWVFFFFASTSVFYSCYCLSLEYSSHCSLPDWLINFHPSASNIPPTLPLPRSPPTLPPKRKPCLNSQLPRQIPWPASCAHLYHHTVPYGALLLHSVYWRANAILVNWWLRW